LTGLQESFVSLVSVHGSPVTYHREYGDQMIVCPCRTPEGSRDMDWHIANPAAPLCSERAYLSGSPITLSIKGFVQPIQSTRATRLQTEFLQSLYGIIEADDHLGILPEAWGGYSLDFLDWSQSGDEYLIYNSRKFFVVNANLIPDPSDGNPRHHWEVGLRLMTSEPLGP
jgi:hypothetical protein